jgi:NADH-quinone oxidoreductase subunit C
MQIPAPVDPVSTVRNALPDAIQDVKEFRGELTLICQPERIVEVARFLRDTPGLIYNYLSDISSVDYYPDYYSRPGRYGVSYHLYSMLYNRRIRIKVYLQEDNPRVPTLTTLWPAANWLEREIIDLFGIVFDGHPDPRRLLLPEDWDGYPGRRDVPLGVETVQFSFNAEEIDQHKPYATE